MARIVRMIDFTASGARLERLDHSLPAPGAYDGDREG
jgi:hypothetical protein